MVVIAEKVFRSAMSEANREKGRDRGRESLRWTDPTSDIVREGVRPQPCREGDNRVAMVNWSYPRRIVLIDHIDHLFVFSLPHGEYAYNRKETRQR